MLKYITEAEYRELLGVNSIPDNFNNLVIDVSAYLNLRTRGRIDIDYIPNEVKYVTALLTQKKAEAESKKVEMGNLKSQNIEGWSESYMTPEEIDKKFKDEMSDIIRNHLWNVIGKDGQLLLYCGV